jgi:prepilin-type N-terminal cleavage/methylation domain-containing protein/prepilin-type processing-associated H-X9-DG protein
MLSYARSRDRRSGFTLVEMLVVISIISLLISILMPSLSRAREQAKATHCLAKLKDMGNAIATYEYAFNEALPPARWSPDPDELDEELPYEIGAAPLTYGWTEVLFSHLYGEPVRVPQSFPVQRNIESERWEEYFVCKSVGDVGVSSGHYRVYLPAWAAGNYTILPDGTVRTNDSALSGQRDRVRPKLPLIGDANEYSERGDGLGTDDCSFIHAGEANYAGNNGRDGNRFSDRHSGGTNFLFQDLHAARSVRLRKELARDWDLDGDLEVLESP